MLSIPHKTKQFLVLVIKILIVLAAFYFIYEQLMGKGKLDWTKFQAIFDKNMSLWSITFVLFLSFLNRFLEILKWQNLVSHIKPITIGEATSQVLGSLTLGIFTPNGFGEYAGKALFFKKIKTKKIIFLNVICNGIQLILTVFFGTIGLFFLGYWQWSLFIMGITSFLLTFSFLSKKVKIKGYSLEKLQHKIQEIPKAIHQKNIILGIARYLTFSHQYYFLFLLFGVNQPYFTLMATITTVYLLASSLPSFQFLDFAVKGSVAVYFFKLIHVNEWIVLFITTIMWFLNVVVPVAMGSYYVLKFKPQWES
jgi:hypothetical protein